MAKRRTVKRHKPTAKAKAAYNKLIVKSYNRLHNVISKHNPRALRIHHG